MCNTIISLSLCIFISFNHPTVLINHVSTFVSLCARTCVYIRLFHQLRDCAEQQFGQSQIKIRIFREFKRKVSRTKTVRKSVCRAKYYQQQSVGKFRYQDDEREVGNNTRLRICSFFPQSFLLSFSDYIFLILISVDLTIVAFSLDFKFPLIIFSTFFFNSLDTRVEEKRW